MKDFTDVLLNTALEREIPKIDQIMNEVTRRTAEDLLETTVKLLDSYYDNYIPTTYVRLYEPKRTIRNKNGNKNIRKPKKGGISLYDAVKHMDFFDSDIALVSRGNFEKGYIGGIVFDDAYFAKRMRHPDKGIPGWNIVENFLFSESDGKGNHPEMKRSVQYEGYSGEAGTILNNYLNNYFPKIQTFYKEALAKYNK